MQLVKCFAVYAITAIFAYTGLMKMINYGVYSNYILHNLSFLPRVILNFALAVPFLEFIVAAGIFYKKTRIIAFSIAILHFMLMSVFWLYASVTSKAIDFSRPLVGMMSTLNNIEHFYFNFTWLILVAVACLLNSALLPRMVKF